MAPAKMQDVNLAEGLQFQLTTTQLKSVETLIKSLKELKSLKEQLLVLEKETYSYLDKEEKSGKDLGKDAKARKQTIQDIAKIVLDYSRQPAVKGAATARLFNKAMMDSADTQWQRATGGKPVEKGIDWLGGKKPTFEVEERIRELEREGEAQDHLRKKSAWQMVYAATLGSAWKMMTDNSKVLAHYTQVIGAAFGFILDMVLINLMPLIVPFVEKLFAIGEWFDKLDPKIKTVIATITGLALVFGGIVSLLWLKSITDAIVGIGTAAVTAGGATGVGALSKALGALVSPIITVAIGVAVAEMFTWVYNALTDMYKKGWIKAGASEGQANFAAPITTDVLAFPTMGPVAGMIQKEVTALNVVINIAGEAIDKSLFSSQKTSAQRTNTGISS